MTAPVCRRCKIRMRRQSVMMSYDCMKIQVMARGTLVMGFKCPKCGFSKPA